jgi:hypothetical protein
MTTEHGLFGQGPAKQGATENLAFFDMAMVVMNRTKDLQNTQWGLWQQVLANVEYLQEPVSMAGECRYLQLNAEFQIRHHPIGAGWLYACDMLPWFLIGTLALRGIEQSTMKILTGRESCSGMSVGKAHADLLHVQIIYLRV